MIDNMLYFFAAMIFCSFLISRVNRLLPPEDHDLDQIERSGLIIITDHGTGLQYLATAEGGLTPRLDIFGQHMRGNN